MLKNEYDIALFESKLLYALKCEKGRFYPDKNYGKRIYDKAECDDYITAIFSEALLPFEGVTVVSVCEYDDKISVKLMINNEERTVIV